MILHYTDLRGFNVIKSQPVWVFKANQPRSPNHPKAVYFTTLPPNIPKLAPRLRVPRRKLEYVFAFRDAGDLSGIRGGRGKFIFYFPGDYEVCKERQI